ncbi:MAG: hypothetical protein ABIZ18_09955 [Caldimonas sp.]
MVQAFQSPFRGLLLGSCLGLCVSAVSACPPQGDRATIEKDILSGWKVGGVGSPVDYWSFLPFPDNPGQCVVLVSLKQGQEHAVGGIISILEFSAHGSEWTKTFEQKNALSLGSFGKAPKGKLLKLGKTRTALAFEVDGMHFGYIGTSLVLLAKIAGRYTQILSLDTHYDNSGTGEDAAWEWNGTLEFLDTGGEFPDIRVSFSGTEGRDRLIYPVNRVERYTFVGHAYKRVQ